MDFDIRHYGANEQIYLCTLKQGYGVVLGARQEAFDRTLETLIAAVKPMEAN